MAEIFDPYHRWLGISPKDQPPNYYRLLAIDRFESDLEVIRDAADRQMAHVRSYQLGPYSALSQKILNELAAARTCLLNAERKAVYDEQLRENAASGQPPAQADASAVDAGLNVSGIGRRRQGTLGKWRLWQAFVAVAAGAAVLVGIALLLRTTAKRRVAPAVPIQHTAPPPKSEKPVELGGMVPVTLVAPVGKGAGDAGAVSDMSQHSAWQPQSEEPLDLGGRPSIPAVAPRGKKKAGAAASPTNSDVVPPRPLATRPPPPAPSKPPHPSPTWKTTGEYPLIAGFWWEGKRRVAITQRQGNFTAGCAYHHPKYGEIRWEMPGTISKNGRLSGTLTHNLYPKNVGWPVVQERVGKLDVEGTTIHGHSVSDGIRRAFTWTLERRLPAE